MRKHFTVIVLGISLFSTANAQLSLGVKAGGAITHLAGDFNGDSKTGFLGGITAGYKISKPFSIQAELYYASQGGKLTVSYGDQWDPTTGTPITTTPSGPVKASFNLNYINLPVLIRYKHACGFFAETGVQAGFLASANLKSYGSPESIKSTFKSVDFSWVGGVGYRLPMGLGINVRYDLGISNILKDGSSNYKWSNNAVQAGLFYTLWHR